MPSSPNNRRAGKPGADLALLHSPTEDGEGARILRYRDGELTAGEVRPVKEGQSINDRELIKLERVAESSPVCQVEVVHHPTSAAKPTTKRAGPARVATDKYRRNWRQVFVRGKRAADKTEPDWSVN